MEAMFISHAIFLLHKQYLLFKVHCQSFAGMINQNSEKSCSMTPLINKARELTAIRSSATYGTILGPGSNNLAGCLINRVKYRKKALPTRPVIPVIVSLCIFIFPIFSFLKCPERDPLGHPFPLFHFTYT